MAGTSERRGLAGQVAVYLPAAAALVCILAAGIFAERQSSDLARLTEARSVRQRSEAAAADLYDAIMPQIQAVERLAGALAVRPAADAADLAGLLPVARAAETVAVLPPDGAPIVYPEGAGARAALATAAAAPLGAGGGFVDDPDGDWFVLWTDVPAGGRAAVATPAALVTAAARRESAGLAASLAGPQASVQRIAGSDAAPVDPLEVPVALPGGGWTLRAAPVGGWEPAGARWPIRLATLVAAALIVGPMIRNRHLVEDRQQTITALGEREAELAQLSRRLELALDASRVGVWDYSFDTDRLVWDDRMDELYGYVPGDRPRSYLDWRDRLHPDDLARAEAEFREAIEVTGRYVSDYRLVLPGNHVRHIRAIGAVYRGAAGGSQIVGVNWDVTADVLRNEELNARRLEAENASLAKSQFLATMCHEIRTPMNGVSGMLDLMLRAELDPDQRGRAVVARTSADQLLAILNDILDLSKLEANRVTVESVAANVHRMARDVVALMAAGSGGRDVAVTVEIAPDVPRVLLCDAKRVRQVLMNLVGNAVKFTEAGGVQVRLGYAPEVDRLEVAVRDTGIGITDEAKRTLFQRFTQVESAVTRKRGGTGLGLAISRQLVELMGGEITVDSVPGLGSTFRFWVPAPPAAPGEEEADAAALAMPTPAMRPARILVAEDNPTNRQILAAYLAMAGHSTHLVNDGAEACAAMEGEAFDLVIMDVQMPVMDGVTATRRIRDLDGDKAGVPIIALTANAMQGDRDRFIAAGMNDYVSKPVMLPELYGAIARCLDGYFASSDGATGCQPSPGSKLSMAAATLSVSSPRSFS